MSFILDALRKSEHDRQRSAVPGLSQVPLATPRPQMPRWALAVIGVLVAAVLLLGGAWWQSARVPTAEPTASAPTVERNVRAAAADAPRDCSAQAAPARPPAREDASLSAAAASSAARRGSAARAPRNSRGGARRPAWSSSRRRGADSPSGAPALPSAAHSPPKASSFPRCGSSCTRSARGRETASSSSTAASTSKASGSPKGRSSWRSSRQGPCSRTQGGVS